MNVATTNVGVSQVMPSAPPGKPQNPHDAAYGPRLYTLDDEGSPIGTFDALAWARWMDSSDARTILYQHHLKDGARVLTQFLGVDQAYGTTVPPSTPLLWQTTIDGGHRDGYVRLWSTRDSAERGHAEALDYATTTNGNGGVHE